ncbi:hypothetical protein HPB47_007350 [Ixodes persulcatus]|uniref:Uncharacterized protein n=1 Tax=Ixodes persulcatus TaxID=34615 RepID=A0AC60P7T8_IXOPE|nr:hypothetical protein HPB47_007350 [Ixodes persulcatus]
MALATPWDFTGERLAGLTQFGWQLAAYGNLGNYHESESVPTLHFLNDGIIRKGGAAGKVNAMAAAPPLPQHLSPAPATVLPLNQHNIPPPQRVPLLDRPAPTPAAAHPLDQHHAPPAALPALEILVNRAIKD